MSNITLAGVWLIGTRLYLYFSCQCQCNKYRKCRKACLETFSIGILVLICGLMKKKTFIFLIASSHKTILVYGKYFLCFNSFIVKLHILLKYFANSFQYAFISYFLSLWLELNWGFDIPYNLNINHKSLY